ncbi:hypothetical protein [Kingella potus]|uniref:hypothetical protein n=1 Tax=Kingella potus TaxID=265175 RepID=UPI001FD623B6|nr:hypothetical protein [Kingella potus]UOP00198.1 hypothetical protein LVJ84_09685 [Kingella potus]
MCRPKRRTRSQARNKHPRSQNKNRVRGCATHPTLKHRGRLKSIQTAFQTASSFCRAVGLNFFF